MSKQDDKHKHLEFIQLIITRMGANSFLIKGWTVTISAALFALADRDSNPTFVIIALVAAISFWGLDAYYLRQERLFIKLYEHTVDDEVKPFSMDVSKYSSEVSKWSNTLFSTTVIGLHGVTLLAIISSIFFL